MSDVTIILGSSSEAFSTWDSLRINDSFMDPLGSYSLTVRPARKEVLRYSEFIRKGELFGIQIDGHPQATPVITSVTKAVDRQGVTFSIEAKSVLVTPYEGSVDPNVHKRYPSDAPIQDVVIEVMKHYGFAIVAGKTDENFKVMSGKTLSGRKPPNLNIEALKAKEVEAKPGETAYGFVSRLFTRLGLVMHVDALGELMLSSPDYDQPAAYTLVQDSDMSNRGDRMLDGIQVTETNSMQFSEIVVLGSPPDAKGSKRTNKPSQRVIVKGTELRKGTPFQDSPTVELDATLASYSTSGGPIYKPKIILDKESRDNKRALSTAKLAMGARASNGYQIRCRVAGFTSKTGHIWTPNSVARVVIQSLGIDEEMWVLERTFSQDRSSGQTTDLTLIPKYSLILGDVPN